MYPNTLSEDTIYLTIPDAEQRFVSKNLTLLINKYNIDIAKANYLQARLWFNPNLYYGTTLYNVENYKFIGEKGSSYYPNQDAWDETWNVQQLLTLAGRFSDTWKLAAVGIKQAQYQLDDILRNLKYELYTDISDLYFNQQQIKMYKYEEIQMQHLLDVTRELYKHGNAAGNDVIQLQQQLQDAVASEIASQQSTYGDVQDLKILLRCPDNTYFVIKELPPLPANVPTFQAMIDSAEKNRPDLLLCYAGCEFAEKNLKLQRSTAVPDLTIGGTFTGVNAGTPAYVGIFGSMDLPVFNRNQWNIMAAKYAVSQQEESDTLTLSAVQNQVTNAYCTLLLANRQLSKIDPDYGKNLDEMMDNAIKNYERRNIDMLQLLSLIGTYNDGKANLINLNVQYYNAVHNINLNTGIEIIK
ncbi:MAG: TolC family protein [Bacteroidia bacterium]